MNPSLPLEDLKNKLNLYKVLVAATSAVALFTIIAVPLALKSDGVPVVRESGAIRIETVDAWKLSPLRHEYFLKKYLSLRFEWTKATYSTNQEGLKSILDSSIQKKVEAASRGYEDLAKNQGASSYMVYLPESFSFSNATQSAEARIIRVTRIRSVTVAVPLIVRVKTKNVALTYENPFGLQITDLEELEDSGGRDGKSQ
jgi:hypothetical protein